MVSSEKKEVLWIFDFVGKQQADGLQWLLASVNIVSQKKVVTLWWISSILEKPEQVIVLTMNITCSKDRFLLVKLAYLNWKSKLNKKVIRSLPQILRGASSSRSIGWLRKISRDFRHSPRISCSVNWTFLPGLEPFTRKRQKIIIILLNFHMAILDSQNQILDNEF